MFSINCLIDVSLFQVNDTLTFFVSIEDEVNGNENGIMNNVVTVPVSIIITDENDNPPSFQNVSCFYVFLIFYFLRGSIHSNPVCDFHL